MTKKLEKYMRKNECRLSSFILILRNLIIKGLNHMSEQENVFETCIVCKKPTKVLTLTHIAKRECYVEGAGQLCRSCYARIYADKEAQKRKNSRGV